VVSYKHHFFGELGESRFVWRGRGHVSGWRKIAPAIWSHPRDPQIYGELDVDATALLKFIEETRADGGPRVTVTHLVGRAIAHTLAEHPELNCALARNRFVPRETVDISFVVAVAGGRDLSSVKIRNADRKSVFEVAEELSQRANRVRTGQDAEFGRMKGTIERTPPGLLRLGLRVADKLTGDWRLDLRRWGLPRDPFGSAMVTSVGMFGVQRAYAPLSPYYRVPFIALVTEVAEQPVVVDGQVTARPMLAIAATMDHRYLDGAHAARLAHAVRDYLADPGAHEARPVEQPAKEVPS
jgi:pyruvate/2-oxoglutarate dehydrogenase complex dihydrolipoamide acyltransferase (E2) component